MVLVPSCFSGVLTLGVVLASVLTGRRFQHAYVAKMNISRYFVIRFVMKQGKSQNKFPEDENSQVSTSYLLCSKVDTNDRQIFMKQIINLNKKVAFRFIYVSVLILFAA